LAALTMTVGNVVALAQSNLKRMLAYSSIAHVGYMLMGLVAGGAPGAGAILFYLLAYTFTVVGAFGAISLCARAGEEAVEVRGRAPAARWSPAHAADHRRRRARRHPGAVRRPRAARRPAAPAAAAPRRGRAHADRPHDRGLCGLHRLARHQRSSLVLHSLWSARCGDGGGACSASALGGASHLRVPRAGRRNLDRPRGRRRHAQATQRRRA